MEDLQCITSCACRYRCVAKRGSCRLATLTTQTFFYSFFFSQGPLVLRDVLSWNTTLTFKSASLLVPGRPAVMQSVNAASKGSCPRIETHIQYMYLILKPQKVHHILHPLQVFDWCALKSGCDFDSWGVSLACYHWEHFLETRDQHDSNVQFCNAYKWVSESEFEYDVTCHRLGKSTGVTNNTNEGSTLRPSKQWQVDDRGAAIHSTTWKWRRHY